MSRTLTRKLAIIEPGLLLVGVDLGREKNVAVVINQQAKQLACFSFGHHRSGYDQFRGQLERLCQREGAPGVLVGLEPTNYFWRLVAAELERHGLPYRLVNPYTVRKYREGTQLDRAKDDRRDGFTIADLLRSGKFTETQRLQGAYAELRQFALLYWQLDKEVRRQRTRLQQAVGQLFPELGTVFKELNGLTVTALLHRHAAAVALRALEREEFIGRVRADFSGQRLSLKQLHQVHNLAQESVGLLETQALQLAVTVYLETIAQLQARQERARAGLLETFLALSEAPYILSLGLGLTSSALLLAEIGDPRAYRSGKELVKLAGLQPTPNHSGKRQSGATPISRKGRSRMRTLLYFAAMRLVQQDDAFATRHHHFQQRACHPLTPKQSLTALSAKMLHILWALIQQRCLYDPAFWCQQRRS